jgi:hypothetical protein
MTRIPYQWNAANFKWNENIYTWDDCALIIDIVNNIRPGGPGLGYDNLIPGKKKKKKFIKLLCKVQGVDYEKNKEILETRIFIKDIKMVAEAVLGVSIKIDID